MVARLALLSVIGVSLAACSVGEVPIAGVDANDAAAEASFNQQILPLAQARGCLDGAACHAGVQMPILNNYSMLTVRYKTKPGSTNILVTKGNLTGGIHQAVPYFDPQEQATVAAWIDSL
jgi:hypothetical protein